MRYCVQTCFRNVCVDVCRRVMCVDCSSIAYCLPTSLLPIPFPVYSTTHIHTHTRGTRAVQNGADPPPPPLHRKRDTSLSLTHTHTYTTTTTITTQHMPCSTAAGSRRAAHAMQHRSWVQACSFPEYKLGCVVRNHLSGNACGLAATFHRGHRPASTRGAL